MGDQYIIFFKIDFIIEIYKSDEIIRNMVEIQDSLQDDPYKIITSRFGLFNEI